MEPRVLLLRLAVLTILVGFSFASVAESKATSGDRHSSEAMAFVSLGCESCSTDFSSCEDASQSPFSLPPRDVYVAPKNWWRKVHKPLTVEMAMGTAFGNYHPDRRHSMHWVDATGTDPHWGLRSGWACAQAVLLYPVIEKGRMRYWLVTVSCSEGTTGFCHACSAVLSIFSFQETRHGWRVVARSTAPIRSGEYGHADAVFLVRLGENRVGLWMQGCGMAQGYVGGIAELFALSGNKFEKVFAGRTIANATDMIFGKGDYVEYRYRFEPSPGREFDDLLSRVRTLSWKKYKRIVKVEEKRYTFRNGRYVPER